MKLSVEIAARSAQWEVDAERTAETAVALTELMLAANATRLRELQLRWPSGVIAICADPSHRFTLVWDDEQHVYLAAGDTFAEAFARFVFAAGHASGEVAA
ncbi:MAG: hypothetical protein ACXWNK_00300 [Vulcanimicrobiaceae bacterium]